VYSFIAVAIQNVESTIFAFGICREKFPELPQRDFSVAINIAATKPQIEALPFVVVRNRRQHLRLHRHPVQKS
jgi:hypothetical protein